MWINSNVLFSAIFLYVPVIGIACVCPVFDPYPSFRVNVPLFPFLGAMCYRAFLDYLFSLLVLFEFWVKRDGTTSRQSCLIYLFVNLAFHRLPQTLRQRDVALHLLR